MSSLGLPELTVQTCLQTKALIHIKYGMFLILTKWFSCHLKLHFVLAYLFTAGRQAFTPTGLSTLLLSIVPCTTVRFSSGRRVVLNPSGLALWRHLYLTFICTDGVSKCSILRTLFCSAELLLRNVPITFLTNLLL